VHAKYNISSLHMYIGQYTMTILYNSTLTSDEARADCTSKFMMEVELPQIAVQHA
jgi:hypothetical protein